MSWEPHQSTTTSTAATTAARAASTTSASAKSPSSKASGKKGTGSRRKSRAGSRAKSTGKPRARPRPWSNEEQQSFWNALETYGRDWHKVAASVKTRDIKSVKSHVQKEFAKRAAEGKPLPAKVRETGEGYTLSGKPLNPESSTALIYAHKRAGNSKGGRRARGNTSTSTSTSTSRTRTARTPTSAPAPAPAKATGNSKAAMSKQQQQQQQQQRHPPAGAPELSVYNVVRGAALELHLHPRSPSGASVSSFLSRTSSMSNSSSNSDSSSTSSVIATSASMASLAASRKRKLDSAQQELPSLYRGAAAATTSTTTSSKAQRATLGASPHSSTAPTRSDTDRHTHVHHHHHVHVHGLDAATAQDLAWLQATTSWSTPAAAAPASSDYHQGATAVKGVEELAETLGQQGVHRVGPPPEHVSIAEELFLMQAFSRSDENTRHRAQALPLLQVPNASPIQVDVEHAPQLQTVEDDGTAYYSGSSSPDAFSPYITTGLHSPGIDLDLIDTLEVGDHPPSAFPPGTFRTATAATHSQVQRLAGMAATQPPQAAASAPPPAPAPACAPAPAAVPAHEVTTTTATAAATAAAALDVDMGVSSQQQQTQQDHQRRSGDLVSLMFVEGRTAMAKYQQQQRKDAAAARRQKRGIAARQKAATQQHNIMASILTSIDVGLAATSGRSAKGTLSA